MIQAKSRVAPVKTVMIPRLELLAATIGTRLATSIVKELEQKISRYSSGVTHRQ